MDKETTPETKLIEQARKHTEIADTLGLQEEYEELLEKQERLYAPFHDPIAETDCIEYTDA